MLIYSTRDLAPHVMPDVIQVFRFETRCPRHPVEHKLDSGSVAGMT